ncbi:hypothetical protein PoB_000396000 [Plakobranchus ocellatus]|uniref:HEAT repeat domain-containing protein n=1 Tax=Plakobranchus ocellatus TaxID=259542 RepID=A0AAV3Y460_9GAST|nr:hypothetical protein PoB_000396000 [Plakobranchus ocellatus]
MKEVFDMNSSVRVDAIENLGKCYEFRTAAVIDALRDLLSDEDANARAVAAVSLARTDASDPVTVKFLMKILNDKDRLVREAGCLALGHLQARQAVNKLLHMWLLNDIMDTEQDLEWLKSVLRREMEVEEDNLYGYELMAFCNIEGEYYSMWERVSIQARESWAMKEVFDMNSSVRVDAIENLGKFRTAAVIDALRDLLSDEDANARAVAAVSLARTDASDPVTVKFLMKILNDKDRLVREAGCLALGHLQARQAVNKLLHMWRNDVISHVREAANVALNQIGGPEVEKAMRVTKVLADEIRQLTAS